MIIQDNSPNTLELDAKHPGLNDQNYVARRQYFFNTSREYRLQRKGLPVITYTKEEDAVWSHVYHNLDTLQQRYAWSGYLHGKEALQLDPDHMPQLYELNKRLAKHYDIGLAPAEGLLDTRDFHGLLADGIMPCTQFIRHHSHPEYTPEPDAVHDVLGHLPALFDAEYTKITRLIGNGVRKSQDDILWQWDKIYWFTIEFGLLEENNELKAFGAGLLSSYGELIHCFSQHVERRPLSINNIIKTEYDPTKMQDILYVIPSLQELQHQLADFISHIG